MSQNEFFVTFDYLCRQNPLGVAKLFLPKGFSLSGGGHSLYEVYDKDQKGQDARAGYIFFHDKGIKLIAQVNKAGEKLKLAWFAQYPILNPKRLVWRLFRPGIFNRKIMGFLPDEQIGFCETLEELDQKMGDTQLPFGTIAVQYEFDALSFFDSYLAVKQWCHANENGGLKPISNESQDIIHITNQSDWDNDR